ncbi:DNA polymerase-3 subunit beta [Nitrosomonas sp. Nm51]|uniref:DNA polymerase III subunit beta n=1 Tax=Nitrosomonas sp. Nm51 TaxID=133720 RepID=UPI0008B72271|nr:DNA polymerase III subunit beta [Nitrosomonas sp. Nm51]SER29492.1 DNA polymerase-3 subunit beta [Nitrosomonas sp. Nm51]
MILIKTNRDNLIKPLQMVAGIVEKRQTFPILSNVLIENNEGTVRFLTSDSEMQIETTSTVKKGKNQNFSLTVSVKKLLDILRSLDPDAEVSFLKKDEKLQIKSGNSQFSLQMLPAGDFPTITEDNESTAVISLPQNTLRNLLNNVQYAIAEQDIRYFLNGVLLSVENGELITVGTDTHRLAFASTQIQSNEVNLSVILPRKTVIELLKLLKDDKTPVSIEIFSKRVILSFSNIVLLSKVIDGKYPNFNRAIPTQNDKTFDLDRLSFLHVLQRVSILSNSNELLKGVRLLISNEKLGVICKNTEQEEAFDEIAIIYSDNDIDYSLNITYLTDLLNHVSVDTIRFAFSDAASSVLITIPGRDDFKYVIMPMRI